MDERQTKIVEGAGLEESRVNQEFLDLLQKWSTPVLLLVLVISGGYAGLKYLNVVRTRALDEAFYDYNEAELEGRPEVLLEVASDHAGQGAVEELAYLTAADLNFNAYRLRIRPGTRGDAPEDRLDDAAADEALTTAGELYTRAYEGAKGKPGRELIEVGSRWGIAAVALSQHRFDDAKSELEEIVELCRERGYDGLAKDGQALLAKLPELRSLREPAASAAPPPLLTPVAPSDQEAGDAPADDPAGPAENAESPDGTEDSVPPSDG